MTTIETEATDANAETVLVAEPERNRWAAKRGERTIGALTYQFAGNRYVLISTHVDSDHRHQGLATMLTIKALDDIQATGKKITVICPFVGDVIGQHPNYFDLVDPVHPGSGISGTQHGAADAGPQRTAPAGRTSSMDEDIDAAPDDCTARIMVLGTIAYRGPLTVPGIAAVLREWMVSQWATTSAEAIEYQIRALVSSGVIRQEISNAGEAQFHCTEQGRTELHRLLLRLVSADTFEPFNLMPLLHFVTVLSPSELADGLRRRILYIDEVLAYLSSVISNAPVDGPDHPSEIVRLNWHRYNADRAWTLEFIGRLYGAVPTGSSTS